MLVHVTEVNICDFSLEVVIIDGNRHGAGSPDQELLDVMHEIWQR